MTTPRPLYGNSTVFLLRPGNFQQNRTGAACSHLATSVMNGHRLQTWRGNFSLWVVLAKCARVMRCRTVDVSIQRYGINGMCCNRVFSLDH